MRIQLLISIFLLFVLKTGVSQNITITAPVGGVAWNSSTYYEIRWTSTYPVDFVDIEVSTDGGATYTLVAKDVPAILQSYAYFVTVPGGNSLTCRIKSSTNANDNDVELNAATILTAGSTATLNSPNPSSSYCTGGSFTLPYSGTGTFNAGNLFYAILLDAVDPGFSPRIIASAPGTSGSGTFSGTIPTDIPPGSNYVIVLSSTDDPGVSAPSPAITINNLGLSINPAASVYSNTLPFTQNLAITSSLTNIIAYAWNFGDNNTVLNDPSPSHQYAQYGNYTVVLDAIRNDGCVQTLIMPYLVAVDPVFPTVAANPPTPTFNANDVFYLNKDTVVSVGDNGMVWRSIDGGLNYSVMSAFTGTQNNNGVIMTGKYICIAGNQGTVTFSNDRGASWSTSAQAQPLIDYHDVNFADTTFGVSVGDAGDAVVYKWVGGLGWSHIVTGLTQKLNTVVSYKTSTSVFQDGFSLAAGDGGVLSHYSFGSWTNSQAPVTTNILQLYLFPDNTTVLASGENGLIMRSLDFGATWTVVHSGTPESLNGISQGIVPNQVFVVGDNGVIYESMDNGVTFTRYSVGFTTSNLKGTSARTPRGAFGGSGNTLRVIASTDTITVTGVNGFPACAGDAVNVIFTNTGLYEATNNFTVELSDAAGLFNSPVVIGSLSNATSPDTISAIIPFVTGGTQYRVRVVSTDPVVPSPDNGTNLTIYPLVPLPVITLAGSPTQLYVNSGAGLTYQWYYNGNPLSGAIDTIITTVGNGNYVLVATNASGCNRSSVAYTYSITGLAAVATDQFSIYPNPSTGVLYIHSSEGFMNKPVEVIDVIGNVVFRDVIRSTKQAINIGDLSNGVYFIKTGTATKRIIKN